MDAITHLLWTSIIFYGFPNRKTMLLFSILPDLLSWGFYAGYVLKRKLPIGKPNLRDIPRWAHTLYNVTHSIFTFIALSLIVWFITKRPPFIMLPWLLHLMLDIPTHSREYLATPFLWPLSSWVFPGVGWESFKVMVINYIAIISLLAATLIMQQNLLLLFLP